MSKISELSDGGSLLPTDDLIVVRSGGNVRVKADTVNVDQIRLGDNEQIQLGNSQDLTLVHTSTQSIINQAGTGDLLIQKAGSTKLTVNSSGIDVTGTVTASGEVFIAEKLTHTGDTDTHLKFAGANDIRIVAGDVEHCAFDGTIVFNQTGSSTMDFRVESDTQAHMLFVDASANRVGVGTNAPSAPFHSSNTSSGLTARFSNDVNQTLDIGTVSGTGSNGSVYIDSANSGNLQFRTGGTERIRIDGAGNVGIGNSGPASYGKFVVQGTGNLLNLNATSGVAYQAFYENGTGRFYLGTLNGSDGLAFIDADGSTERMRIDSGGNVGISTNDPQKTLDVKGTFAISNSTTSYWDFDRDDSDGSLKIADTGTERMRIDASGNLLVGGTSTNPTGQNVAGAAIDATGEGNFSVDGAEALRLNRKQEGDIQKLMVAGATVGSIGVSGGNNLFISGQAANHAGLTFATDAILPTRQGSLTDNVTDLGASSERFKDLHLSGGAYLGGTGAANKLDDYEEGTFTPTIIGSGTNPTVTYGTRIGKYTKVGNLVSVYVSISTSDFSGGSGNLIIDALPFTASQDCGGGAPMFYKVNSFAETAPFINSGTAYVLFLGRDNTDTSTAWSIIQTSAWTAANPTLVQFQMTYFAS